MPRQELKKTSVEPVFVLSKNLPDKVDIIGMCSAGERVVGTSGIEGAYQDGGLWRIYPMSPAGRIMLLSRGINIGGLRVSVEATNPFILQGQDAEQPSTRLTVGPLPRSISDDVVLRALEKSNIRVRSKVMWEMARFRDRSLTDWKTMRRFLWIELPSSPPQEFIQMGPCKVKISYREFRDQTTKCYNCQQFGHRSSECQADPVCFVCKQTGHKKGDPACTGHAASRPAGFDDSQRGKSHQGPSYRPGDYDLSDDDNNRRGGLGQKGEYSDESDEEGEVSEVEGKGDEVESEESAGEEEEDLESEEESDTGEIEEEMAVVDKGKVVKNVVGTISDGGVSVLSSGAVDRGDVLSEADSGEAFMDLQAAEDAADNNSQPQTVSEYKSPGVENYVITDSVAPPQDKQLEAADTTFVAEERPGRVGSVGNVGIREGDEGEEVTLVKGAIVLNAKKKLTYAQVVSDHNDSSGDEDSKITAATGKQRIIRRGKSKKVSSGPGKPLIQSLMDRFASGRVPKRDQCATSPDDFAKGIKEKASKF